MTKIIIGVAALVLLIGIGYTTMPSFINNSSSDIYVFVESGNVFVKENKDATYVPVSEKKIAIKTGAYVKTEIGNAHILFPDNSVISLSENSELEINYTKHRISVNQLAGDTYHRVQKLASGNTYEVSTAGTLAAVRGTKFAVRYNAKSKKAKVAVLESVVAVSRINASTTIATEVKVGMTANVDENVSVDSRQSVRVASTNNDASMSEWLKRNIMIDEYIGNNTKTFLENFIKTDSKDTLRMRLDSTRATFTAEVKTTTDSKKVSLKSLIASGGSQKCSYSYNANGVTSSAIVYVGNGKMRTDSTININGRIMEYHMILMDDTSYVWGDGMPQGMKMSVATMSAPKTAENTQTQTFDMSKEMAYSCNSWSMDIL